MSWLELDRVGFLRAHPQRVRRVGAGPLRVRSTDLTPKGGSGKLFCPDNGRGPSGLSAIDVLDEWFPISSVPGVDCNKTVFSSIIGVECFPETARSRSAKHTN